MGIEQEPLQPAPTTSATGRVTRRGSMEGILVPLAAIVQAELGSAQFSGDRLFAEHSVLCWFILVVQPEVTTHRPARFGCDVRTDAQVAHAKATGYRVTESIRAGARIEKLPVSTRAARSANGADEFRTKSLWKA